MEKGIAPHPVQGDISKDVAYGIAITSLLFALSIYMPIIGIFCALLIPLPILFYRLKLGRKTGILILGLTSIVMVVMLGKISIDILFFMELLLLGFVLSELIELNLSIEKTILYACSTVLFIGIVGLLFYSNLTNTGIYTLVSEYVEKNLKLTMAIYKDLGVPEENIYLISNSLEHIQYVLVRIVPAVVVASTLFVAWTCLLIARPILKNRGLFYPAFGTLNLWKAPESLVWCVIGCGLMILVPSSALKMFGLNGLLILMTIYFFQGIAIVSFYLEKKHVPRLVRLLLYSLIALQQVVLVLVVCLGFFDIWLNLRNRSKRPPA